MLGGGSLKTLEVEVIVGGQCSDWGSLQTLEVEVTVGGQCHCRCSESMRRLRVEVTSGQGHCKNSGPLGTLGAVVDIHGQGSCSAQEHQAGSTR